MNENKKCYGQHLQERSSQADREMGQALLALGVFFLLLGVGGVLSGLYSGATSASDAIAGMLGIGILSGTLIWGGWCMWKV